MAFRDLTEIIGPLELPIRGKVYTLPVVSAPDGARILSALQGKGELSDAQLKKILLASVEKQMIADGVKPPEINRVLWTALADVQNGRAVAEVIWEQGIDPKALEATTNRAARRSKPSAAASTTKRPASTSTTKKA